MGTGSGSCGQFISCPWCFFLLREGLLTLFLCCRVGSLPWKTVLHGLLHCASFHGQFPRLCSRVGPFCGVSPLGTECSRASSHGVTAPPSVDTDSRPFSEVCIPRKAAQLSRFNPYICFAHSSSSISTRTGFDSAFLGIKTTSCSVRRNV